MQQYNFTVQHIKGSDNPADILSRQPLPFDAQISEEEKLAEGFINYVVANGILKAMTLSEILEESGKDPTIRALEDAIAKNDWTDKLMEPFKHVRAELTSKRGLMLRGSRIVMPQTLQRRTIQLAHETPGNGQDQGATPRQGMVANYQQGRGEGNQTMHPMCKPRHKKTSQSGEYV
ncbi:hypothetical protein Hamer_G020742 [Homarus americanus]|uniref:Uncharacterized protein n=1 Tax=Homarus americanus TaxID=6706 RepID=A0A8J5JZD7_HOMAM|nr:hypothetical protein Hamer_G020742 [Homarus americanus]